VEGIAEPGFLALLGRESFDWLKVEIVVKMQEIEVLTMDEQHQHVITLSAHLQTHLHPVRLGLLEELCCRESFQQTTLVEGLWVPFMEG
jgi:hypothetical protein